MGSYNAPLKKTIRWGALQGAKGAAMLATRYYVSDSKVLVKVFAITRRFMQNVGATGRSGVGVLLTTA